MSDVHPRRALAQSWGEVEEEGDLPEDEAQVHAVNRVPDSHDGWSVRLSVVVLGWRLLKNAAAEWYTETSVRLGKGERGKEEKDREWVCVVEWMDT